MAGFIFFDAHSDECSAVSAERGQRVVWFRGEKYCIAGLYFAHGRHGQRELRYVLALAQVDDHEGTVLGVAGDGGQRNGDRLVCSTGEES